MRLLPLLAIMVALLSATPTLSAQPPGGKVRERVDQLKKLKLIELLDLDETSSEKFFTRYNVLNKKVEEARTSLQSAVDDLERAIKRSAADAELQKLGEAVLSKQNEVHQAFMEKSKGMKGLLPEEKYALFLVFEYNFPIELQRMILERRDKERPKRFRE